MQMVVPTMSKCKLIETCLECSARTLTFVGEVRLTSTLSLLPTFQASYLPMSLTQLLQGTAHGPCKKRCQALLW